MINSRTARLPTKSRISTLTMTMMMAMKDLEKETTTAMMTLMSWTTVSPLVIQSLLSDEEKGRPKRRPTLTPGFSSPKIASKQL